MHSDTIAAIATASGRGGVGIVRLSGPAAYKVSQRITGVALQHRHATFTEFKDHNGDILDQGIAVFFKGPESFTGEDVVELQAHGSPVVLDLLMKTATLLGARPAGPGEFSQRAFLNDKIDLVQAEAIADLVDSSSEQAARSALRSLRGAFSQHIDAINTRITELRLFVEAAIDFPDEDIDFLADGQIQQRTEQLTVELAELQALANQGVMLRDGINVVLCGRPNAGKSTLLNKLAQEEIAIVTDHAGTTRDTLKQEILLEGIPLHVVDTAGIRASENPIEQEGIRRALEQVNKADIILLVNDIATGKAAIDDPRQELVDYFKQAGVNSPPADDVPLIVINNKIDLLEQPASSQQYNNIQQVNLSARENTGLDLLSAAIKQGCGIAQSTEGNVVARRRHLHAIERALDFLNHGLDKLEAGAPELLAEDLRQAHDQLGEITGKLAPDELLGKIFTSFCIGK